MRRLRYRGALLRGGSSAQGIAAEIPQTCPQAPWGLRAEEFLAGPKTPGDGIRRREAAPAWPPGVEELERKARFFAAEPQKMRPEQGKIYSPAAILLRL
jgi:hypothetical protein